MTENVHLLFTKPKEENLIYRNDNNNFISFSKKINTEENKKITKLRLKYDLNELKEKLEVINNKIKEEKETYIKELNELNKDIEEKNIKIKNLGKIQKKYISKLKIIQNDVNKRVEKRSIIMAENKNKKLIFNNIKKETELIKLISVKEKEISLAEKGNLSLKNSCNEIKLYPIKSEKNLKKDYISLKAKISELNQEIKDLKYISYKHDSCINHKNNLLNYLLLLRNAVHFEQRKNFQAFEKKNLSLNNIFDNNQNNIYYSPKITLFKNLNKNKKNIKSNIINIKTYNYIKNIFDEVNSQNSIKNTKNKNLKNIKSQRTLFNKKENELLSKLIPETYLIKYKNKFEEKEKSYNILKKKINIKLNDMNNNLISHEKNMKLELNEIKQKDVKNEETKLKLKINKNKKKIFELKKSLYEINNEIKNYMNIFNKKSRENKKIENIIQNYLNLLEKQKKKNTNNENKNKNDDNSNNNIDNENNENNREDKEENISKENNSNNEDIEDDE